MLISGVHGGEVCWPSIQVTLLLSTQEQSFKVFKRLSKNEA